MVYTCVTIVYTYGVYICHQCCTSVAPVLHQCCTVKTSRKMLIHHYMYATHMTQNGVYATHVTREDMYLLISVDLSLQTYPYTCLHEPGCAHMSHVLHTLFDMSYVLHTLVREDTCRDMSVQTSQQMHTHEPGCAHMSCCIHYLTCHMCCIHVMMYQHLIR